MNTMMDAISALANIQHVSVAQYGCISMLLILTQLKNVTLAGSDTWATSVSGYLVNIKLTTSKPNCIVPASVNGFV